MTARTRTLVTALLLVLPAALFAQRASNADLSRDLDRLARGELIKELPQAENVAPGARTIAAGSTVRGSVVARGPIDVAGRVEGSVVSLSGDVTVHRGGVVTGDAISVGGRVMADSGQVNGEMRTMATLPALNGTSRATADLRTAAERTLEAAKFVSGTFGVLLIIAIGVLVFAGPNLDEVVATIARQFARAFWYGVLAQIVALPVLCVLVVALTLSVIGILLIPFAVVAYAIACAGLVTLGFLAVLHLVGGALWRAGSASARARALGALAIGIAIFFTLWMIAALFTWSPLAAAVLRAAAIAATWAAMTLGLGAAVLSRAGTHKRVPGSAGGRPAEFASWQTPTPVAGVVAARRQAAVAREVR